MASSTSSAGVRRAAPTVTATPATYNTKNLPYRVAVDIGSAAAAGGLIAPVITMIDKAIIQNASGAAPLMTSIRASLTTLLTRPHHFLFAKPLALIFMVYGGTYLSANTLDTFKSTTTKGKKASATTSGPSKFAATSIANLSLSMVKDSQFTKMFGTATSPRPVPLATYLLFGMRDSLTIFASFNLPPILAPKLPLSEGASKYMSQASAAQFLTPAAIQLISTPFHLLGLDLYNRGDAGWGERARKVRVDWAKSVLARICRIVPAFGVGGVVNNGMRKKLMKGFE